MLEIKLSAYDQYCLFLYDEFYLGDVSRHVEFDI